MSQHFGKEKFHMAMLDLVAPGDIHARVSAALAQHLWHVDAEQDMPPELGNELNQLRQSVSTGGGHVYEAIGQLSETEVEKLAQKIVTLYEKVLSSGKTD